MEAHPKEQVGPRAKPSETNQPKAWTRKLEDQSFCFAAGFSLGGCFDLASLTKSFPEASVVCDSQMVAGADHIEQVLSQATEYWKRHGELAKKKSIDLLMRITCQRQISDAIRLSRIEKASDIAIFGLVNSPESIEKTIKLIISHFPSAKRDDTLLQLDREKTEFLRKVHGLPKSFNRSQILVALKERSALLVFSN